MAESAEPPAAEEVGERPALMRQATVDYESAHPYMKAMARGAMFLAPEANVGQDAHDEDSEGDGHEPTREASKVEVMETPGLLLLEDFLESSRPLAPEDRDFHWTYNVQWKVRLVPDEYADSKHTLPDGSVKPRRSPPHAKASSFFDGLEKEQGAYIFKGELNGWPGVSNLMLVSITTATTGALGHREITTLWKHGSKKPLPDASQITSRTRATMLAPSWTSVGWAPGSPGFVFWYSTKHGEPRVIHGELGLETLAQDDPVTRDSLLKNVHVYTHRYAVANPGWKDMQTWHSLCLLEWEHQQFTTVVELAFLNGVAYAGKANWVEDKLEPETLLLKTISANHGSMQRPYDNSKSEIRMYDTDCKDKAEFDAYIKKYANTSGIPLAQQRFVEPDNHESGACKLRHCRPEEVFGFILNYIQRVPEYKELSLNCQTFATDFFSFLTGSKHKQPYGNAIKPSYQQHVFAFLYQPQHSM